MNSNKNDVDITKWTKASYFHCGLSTKNQKHQRLLLVLFYNVGQIQKFLSDNRDKCHGKI